MNCERQSRRELISFAKTLVSSGCESIGPQCTYVSDVADEDNSLIPSKAVAEVLEMKYGNRSSYAPALADFLSSHQLFWNCKIASAYLNCIRFLIRSLMKAISYF